MVSGGVGDHEGVVGEEVGGRAVEFEAFAAGEFGEGLAEAGVGAHAAADGDGGAVVFAGGAEEFGGEDIDDGGLEGGAEVRQIGLRGRAVFFEKDAHGGFESAETEIEIAGVDHAAWEFVARGIACGGESIDGDAAGVAEAEELGGFVEGLAGGVIEGSAKEAVVSEALDIEQEGVSAADDERGVGRDFFASEKRREEVAFDVVDGEEGFCGTDGQTLCQSGSDKEGGGKAGAGGGGDGVEIGKGEAGFFHGQIDDVGGAGEVVARGDFWNDAAELGVDASLTENLVRADAVEIFQDRCGGFVAGGFDGEDRGHANREASKPGFAYSFFA